jgi:hypothetical protein
MIENRDLSATSILRNIGFPTIWKFRSLTKLQNRFLHHPDLIELANTYRAQLNCLPSADLGLLGINAYVQQNFGVYSPVGGWSKLTELLKVRCAQLGVSFELGQEVKPVELAGQICGVELAGKFKAADFVLLSKSEGLPENLSWLNLPDFITLKANLFVIEEQSWLGLGSAHAVLTGEILANHIGSAS